MTECAVDQPIRHALEARHPSFGDAGRSTLLEEHDVALVASDSPGAWPYFEERTADVHVRAAARPHRALRQRLLLSLPRPLGREGPRTGAPTGLDVYVYFDNDARGRAPHDAVALLDRLG